MEKLPLAKALEGRLRSQNRAAPAARGATLKADFGETGCDSRDQVGWGLQRLSWGGS